MSLDPSRRTPGRGTSTDLWPKWMWVAVPVLVVVVVAGLWWAIFSPGEPKVTPTPSPTPRVLRPPATQAPTLQATLAPGETPPAAEATATRPVVIVYTFTPTAQAVTTPTEAPTVSTGLAIGAKARVTGTGGSGLNMRAGAGTGHARVKTLPEGAIVEIIGGPKDANNYTWWQVKDESGTTGWVVSKFLVQQ
jgi:hypothetical protein